ncbi:MAG: serine kinase [Brevundimonas sp.]|nr:MAG: serine kinase [Brevundimonas sp.]
MTAPGLVHATVVARQTPAGWRAVLIRGASGTGKSDLALRLCAAGWRLVGDDYVRLWPSGDGVFAAPAEALAGRIESRGLGIRPMAWRAPARVVLAVEAAASDAVERMPEPEVTTLAGLDIPLLKLALREASTVAKVAAAMGAL